MTSSRRGGRGCARRGLKMAMLDSPKTVQYVTDSRGQRVAVLLDIRAWDSLLEWIGDTTDVQRAVKALTELRDAGGLPEAGWVPWEKASEEWR